METKYVTHAAYLAKKYAAAAEFVEQTYGTYQDGRGNEHYVSGPACKQLRDIAKELYDSLAFLRRYGAAALPALPEDILDIVEGDGSDDEYEIRIDLATLGQPGWHDARIVRRK